MKRFLRTYLLVSAPGALLIVTVGRRAGVPYPAVLLLCAAWAVASPFVADALARRRVR